MTPSIVSTTAVVPKPTIRILFSVWGRLSTLSNKLYEWTSKKWIVINSSSQGQKTIKEKRDDSELELQSLIKEHPIYKKAEMEFDKVEIISIEEVPKLSIVSNENSDKVKDKWIIQK